MNHQTKSGLSQTRIRPQCQAPQIPKKAAQTCKRPGDGVIIALSIRGQRALSRGRPRCLLEPRRPLSLHHTAPGSDEAECKLVYTSSLHLLPCHSCCDTNQGSLGWRSRGCWISFFSSVVGFHGKRRRRNAFASFDQEPLFFPLFGRVLSFFCTACLQ